MSAVDSFLTLDVNLTIVAWTAGVEQIFGYAAAEILGKPVFTLVPEDQRQAAVEVLKQLSAENQVSGFHAERLTKQGTRVALVADLLAIRDSTGAHCATQIRVRRA